MKEGEVLFDPFFGPFFIFPDGRSEESGLKWTVRESGWPLK